MMKNVFCFMRAKQHTGKYFGNNVCYFCLNAMEGGAYDPVCSPSPLDKLKVHIQVPVFY